MTQYIFSYGAVDYKGRLQMKSVLPFNSVENIQISNSFIYAPGTSRAYINNSVLTLSLPNYSI